MTELNDLYAPELLEISANISHIVRLDKPDVSAQAHSKLCGSTIEIDLKIEEGTVIDFAQNVQACLLGQSAAAIVAKNIIGTKIEELQQVGRQMRDMLKQDGPPPSGRWAELALLESVKHFKARHTSTLLIFEALDKAFEKIKSLEPSEV